MGEKPRQRDPLHTKVSWNVALSNDAITRIHEATGLPRTVNGDELRNWLWEAARCYEVRALPRARWLTLIADLRKVEASAKQLLVSAERVQGRVGSVIAKHADAINAIIVEAQESSAVHAREAEMRRANAPRGGADCILIGGDLPLIFEVLYGRARKAEAPGAQDSARHRFVRAACAALGLKEPTPATIVKHRTRYLALPEADVALPRMLPPRSRVKEFVEIWESQRPGRREPRPVHGPAPDATGQPPRKK
jgi:hypothetical protein